MRLFHEPRFKVAPFSASSPEYSATPTSATGQNATPVAFCLMPLNMYVLTTLTLPVSVNRPGFGSGAGLEVCALTGIAEGKVSTRATMNTRSFQKRTTDFESFLLAGESSSRLSGTDCCASAGMMRAYGQSA